MYLYLIKNKPFWTTENDYDNQQVKMDVDLMP